MDRNTLIEKLKKDIADGRLITITGTGISVATCNNQEIEGFPIATWPGLIRHGIKHLKDIGAATDRVSTLLNAQIESVETDMLISAADVLTQRMQAKSEGTLLGGFLLAHEKGHADQERSRPR